VIAHPTILRSLLPTAAISFVAHHPYPAFVAMGAVVLAITGSEALYAAMGHFGPSPIRRAWFAVVFPALTLNYLGQGALIQHRPQTKANPFFFLVPHWAQLPMLLLATAATVIASQAVISGAFSVSSQAVQLGFLPPLRIRHTSSREIGQVYLPAVNGALFVVVLFLVVRFQSSRHLATAYGVAVTATFLITTVLFLLLARTWWRWPLWRLALLGVLFGGIEIVFFAANLAKITQGGWLPILVAVVVFTIMTTWQRGADIIRERRNAMEGTLLEFIDEVHRTSVQRVPGVAIFPHSSGKNAPLALRANVQHNHVLHKQVVLVTARTVNVAHVSPEERTEIDDLGDPRDGIFQASVTFGYQDRWNIPEALRALLDTDPAVASYFVSRITLRRTRAPGMSGWRKQLFVVLAHNATSQAEYLGLPEDRTVLLSSFVDL
jgi:KUP system potassium uptake protein